MMSKTQDIEKELEKITNITKQMMFVFGDGEEALPECEEFVIQLIRHQLLLLIHKGWDYAKSNGSPVVRLEDILIQFRHHMPFVNRLFKFAQAAHNVIQLSAETNQEDELETVTGNKKKIGGAIAGLLDAADFLGMKVNYDELENYSDSVMDMRNNRLAERVKLLSHSQYERFSNARKAGFTSKGIAGGKSKNRDSLLVWVNAPPTAKFVDFVLAFVAKETLSCIVDDALSVREQEPANLFRDEGRGFPLQMRHYEEALRRNHGFRSRGDFLFGYF